MLGLLWTSGLHSLLKGCVHLLERPRSGCGIGRMPPSIALSGVAMRPSSPTATSNTSSGRQSGAGEPFPVTPVLAPVPSSLRTARSECSCFRDNAGVRISQYEGPSGHVRCLKRSLPPHKLKAIVVSLEITA